MKDTSNLKCPFCGKKQKVEIPQAGCLAFYDCEYCNKRISVPKDSQNCCVICEYGDKKCPMPNLVESEKEGNSKKKSGRKVKNVFVKVAPLLGVGVLTACPVCWIGSIAILSFLGTSALLSIWSWFSYGLIVIGLIGLIMEYKIHKNYIPIIAIILGGVLLYLNKHSLVFSNPMIYWFSVFLIIGAVVYNWKLSKCNRCRSI